MFEDLIQALRDNAAAKQRVIGLVHSGRVTAVQLREAVQAHSAPLELYLPNAFQLRSGNPYLVQSVLDEYTRAHELRVVVDWRGVEAALQREHVPA